MCQGEARGRDLCIHVINGAYTQKELLHDIAHFNMFWTVYELYDIVNMGLGLGLDNYITFCGQISFALPKEAFSLSFLFRLFIPYSILD